MKLFVSALIAACLAAPALAQNVTIRFIANEGVHISDGETGVLIDALTWNSYDGTYALPSDEARAAMINGEAPYDDVVALLFTHIHGDHFDPEGAVAISQNGVTIMGSVQIFDAFIAAGGEEAAITLLEPAEVYCEEDGTDCPTYEDLGNITFFPPGLEFERPFSLGDQQRVLEEQEALAANVDARPIFHRNGVDHWSYRVEIGGVSILHLGDTQPQMADFSVWDDTEFDVILYPYWFAQMPEGVAFLDSRPDARAIAFHIPAAATPQTIRAGLGDREHLFGEGTSVAIATE
ncbi:hypothetical protein V0U79_05965 [Hyphobacterium sp. HN65]|uniref:MBL fold metallo-hydrolase n=1 Tax=Hyphobacterium lacteum TaxID=3116575 RepID=A0ABU7LPR3_9PROT|nr:hypothetical protein [Hyphobacterium sp. HN65]MEE2525904.1 hypothetical protein [Hyphobacterium sp. HN65]